MEQYFVIGITEKDFNILQEKIDTEIETNKSADCSDDVSDIERIVDDGSWSDGVFCLGHKFYFTVIAGGKSGNLELARNSIPGLAKGYNLPEDYFKVYLKTV